MKRCCYDKLSTVFTVVTCLFWDINLSFLMSFHFLSLLIKSINTNVKSDKKHRSLGTDKI